MHTNQVWRSRTVGRRAGFTLVEMLVTISLLSVMTGMAVELLVTLLNSERKGVEHVARLATVSRLSRQFRADVHAATDLQLSPADPQQPLLQITTEDKRQIRYEVQPQGMLRTEQRPAQTTVVKDLLRIQGTRFRIEESTSGPRMLSLVMETPDVLAVASPQPVGDSRRLSIDAVVGRDFRDY